MNIDLGTFNPRGGSKIYATDGTWLNSSNAPGPTEENLNLIAQLTTDGDLQLQLNIQVKGPSGEVLQFVAVQSEGNPDETIYRPSLTYNSAY